MVITNTPPPKSKESMAYKQTLSQEKVSEKINLNVNLLMSGVEDFVDHDKLKRPNKKDTFKFQEINQSFMLHTKRYFKSKNDCLMLVLLAIKAIASKSRNKRLCYASYDTIADLAGTCVKTVARVIEQLKADGLLAIHKRNYQTNVCMLSSAIYVSHIKKSLFKAIKSSLSEYVRLLKDSLLSLLKRKKRFDIRERYICKREKNASLKFHIEKLKMFALYVSLQIE